MLGEDSEVDRPAFGGGGRDWRTRWKLELHGERLACPEYLIEPFPVCMLFCLSGCEPCFQIGKHITVSTAWARIPRERSGDNARHDTRAPVRVMSLGPNDRHESLGSRKGRRHSCILAQGSLGVCNRDAFLAEWCQSNEHDRAGLTCSPLSVRKVLGRLLSFRSILNPLTMGGDREIRDDA